LIGLRHAKTFVLLLRFILIFQHFHDLAINLFSGDLRGYRAMIPSILKDPVVLENKILVVRIPY